MLLPLYHYQPSFSSKTQNHLPPLPPPPLPKPPFLCCNANLNPAKSIPPPHSSASVAPDRKTVPKTAIQRIADKLRSLGYIEEQARSKAAAEKSVAGDASVGEIFASSKDAAEKSVASDASAGEIFLPFPHQLPKYRVGHTLDPSWNTPENPVPLPGSGTAFARFGKVRRELRRQRMEARRTEAVLPTVAELTIPEEELRRLRTTGLRLDKKLKVGKAGITEGIVNGIHERWRRSELVKIKCEDICRMNMKRTHETLERKTGGLVIWRSGSVIILYRGVNYKYPYFLPDYSMPNNIHGDKGSSEYGGDVEVDSEQEGNSSQVVGVKSSTEPISPKRFTRLPVVPGVGSPQKVRFLLPGEIQLEEEVDHLLDGLGPRFTDWWYSGPLPVDADLLPRIVRGYRKPFRLLPFGVHPKLTEQEMTVLKRLGHPLPCHFVLGRNSRLQGLATSIVKLWEKCEIAKIAVKRGAQNTNSRMMAEELKVLTGGILLSRDKHFIVLYRGKDFLPPAVSAALEERKRYGIHREKGRVSQDLLTSNTRKGQAEEAKDQEKGIAMERKLQRKSIAVKSMEAKLLRAVEKKANVEKLIEDIEKESAPQGPDVDKEGITEEERYMLRKVGLSMKPFLLLGRRGVFDGTLENIHLHWKYRELIKIICKERNIEDVHMTAQTLEAESGGILVAVERVSKGYAVILYRGKNYRRPAELRPRTLLNKKQAMKRSLEAQRSKSLKLHVLKLTKDIDKMKHQLAKIDKMANFQSAECIGAKTESETSNSISSDESDDEENVEAEEETKADSSPFHSIACTDSFSDDEGNVSDAIDLIESTSEMDSMQAGPRPCHSDACANSSGNGEENVSAQLDLMESTSEMGCMQDKPIGALSEHGYMLPEVEHSEVRSSSSVLVLDEVEYSSEFPEVKSNSPEPVLDEVEYSSEFPEAKSTSPEPVLDEVEYSSEFLEVKSASPESVLDEVEYSSEFPQDKSASPESVLDEVEYSSEFPEVKSTSSEPVLDEAEYGSDLDSQMPKNLPPRVRIRFSAAEVVDYAMNDGPRESLTDSSGSMPVPAVNKDGMDASNVKNVVRGVPLSNKDRLMLRKQALNMKRRPLFAIGRSNAIAGAARAITKYFEKNHLAVVNVKGRAKGTSIQQMAFELQHATGAMLVSVEENKVILYRGWTDRPGTVARKKKMHGVESWESEAAAVSPQLLAAVRLECGLQNSPQDLARLL